MVDYDARRPHQGRGIVSQGVAKKRRTEARTKFAAVPDAGRRHSALPNIAERDHPKRAALLRPGD